MPEMHDVRRTLDELNLAWRNSRFDELAGFFEENVVMRGPGFKELPRGRQALVQSYEQFMKRSRIIDYSESNHWVDCWGETASATYDCSMTYEQDGQTKQDSGHDMFVFVRRGSR